MAVPISKRKGTCPLLLVLALSACDRQPWRPHLEAGLTAYESGELDGAHAALERALAEHTRVEGEELALAAILDARGSVHEDQSAVAEALADYRKALEIRERRLGEGHHDTLTTMTNLGTLLSKAGELAEAEKLLRHVFVAREKGASTLELVAAIHNLADTLTIMGRYDEAASMFARNIGLLAEAAQIDSVHMAYAKYGLAAVFAEQRKLPEAETLYRESLALKEKLMPPDHDDVLETREALAIVLDYAGKYKEAQPEFEHVLAKVRFKRGDDHPDVGRLMINLALNYSLQERHDEARKLYEGAIPILEKVYGAEHPRIAHAINGLGNVCAAQGDDKKAAVHYQRALAIREKALGKDHPTVATVLFNMSGVQIDAGDLKAAAASLKRAVAIRDVALPPEHPYAIHALERYAEVLRKLKRRKDAAHIEARLRSISVDSEGP